MTKKCTIITIVFAAAFLAALFVLARSSWAQGFLKTPEERAMERSDREMAECKKTERPLECLMEKDQRREEERRRNMTPEEKRQSEEGEQRIKEQWAEIQRLIEEEKKKSSPTPTSPFTREHFKNNPQQFPDFEEVQEGGDEMTRTVLKGSFSSINYWTTILNGESISVSAGSQTIDKLQGVVVVRSDGVSSIKEYPTPSKTGPVKIVSASGETGIIELVSLAGEWEVYHEDTDTRERVHTPGGARYTFNIKTRKFQ